MNALKERKVFFSYPRNMRVLLTANFIYASVLPVIWAFVGVYIMRNSNIDVHLVVVQQFVCKLVSSGLFDFSTSVSC